MRNKLMEDIKQLFIESNYVDDETIADTVRRIGDWLEEDDSSLNDKYVQKQIEYIKQVAQMNKRNGIKSKLDFYNIKTANICDTVSDLEFLNKHYTPENIKETVNKIIRHNS
jgi:hypothetical protein